MSNVYSDGFSFGNIRSQEYGIIITDVKTSVVAARDGSFFAVPGKNGDIYTSDNRRKNVNITYKCLIRKGFGTRFTLFVNVLARTPGYAILKDTIDTETFRMAIFDQQINADLLSRGQAGLFSVQFNCKPQRFLEAGEIPVTFMGTGRHILENYGQPAKPEITVYGSGPAYIVVNGKEIELLNLQGSLILDFETQNAYSIGIHGEIINENGRIWGYEFEELHFGTNFIDAYGGIEKIEVKPRWWLL